MVRTLSLVLLSFHLSVAAAEQPARKRVNPRPDHLVPVAPYRAERIDKYIKECQKILFIIESESSGLFQPHKWGTVVMVFMPSFRPEECIALREEDGAREYNLIHTRADRNIFDSMPEDGNERKPVHVNVVKLVKPLSRERARRIYSLWERMLKGVRYPKEGPRAGCPDDGEAFEFRYAEKGMFGETCSPSDGAPKVFTDLGFAMILCCDSKDDELDKNLNLLDKKCAELESLLDSMDSVKEERRSSAKAREPS